MMNITKKQYREFKKKIQLTGLVALVSFGAPSAYHGLMYYKTKQEVEKLNSQRKVEYTDYIIKKYDSLDVLAKAASYGSYAAARSYYSKEIIDN